LGLSSFLNICLKDTYSFEVFLGRDEFLNKVDEAEILNNKKG